MRFLNATVERSPSGIEPYIEKSHVDNVSYAGKALPGPWVRVFPESAREVLFLQSLRQHIDKFAPVRGGGILIRRTFLDV